MKESLQRAQVDWQYLQECVEAITSEKVEIFSFLDSSSAKALFMRRGVGRVRHLDTRLLWAQDLFQQQRAFLRTVRTKWNIADCGTKALSQRRMNLLLYMCGYVDGETEEPVGEEIFLEEATKEVKATAVKSIRDAVQMFKPNETPRVESQKCAKGILRVMVMMMCASSAMGENQEMRSNNALNFVEGLFADNLEYFLMFCVIFTVFMICRWMFNGAWKICSMIAIWIQRERLAQERSEVKEEPGRRRNMDVREPQESKPKPVKAGTTLEGEQKYAVTRHGAFFHMPNCKWVRGRQVEMLTEKQLVEREKARCRTCFAAGAARNRWRAAAASSYEDVE